MTIDILRSREALHDIGKISDNRGATPKNKNPALMHAGFHDSQKESEKSTFQRSGHLVAHGEV